LAATPLSEEDYAMTTQTKSKAAPKAAAVSAEAYEQVVETTKAQVEKTNEAVVKGYDEFAALQQEGVDALIKAGEIWARGAEVLGKAYLAAAQDAAEANSSAAKALFSAKSLKEVVELQSEIARKSFDKSLSESTKLSELSVKVANEAFQPIQQQFTAVVTKAGKLAA
jgi:phasin family protein